MGMPPTLHFQRPTDDFTQCKGGAIIYESPQLPEVYPAVLAISKSLTDPKASVFASNRFQYGSVGVHSFRRRHNNDVQEISSLIS